MKKKNTFTYLLIGLGLCFSSLGSGLRADTPENYTNNRYPLVRKPFMELPLGSIKAKGWLQEMLGKPRLNNSSTTEAKAPKKAGRQIQGLPVAACFGQTTIASRS